jgi:hypothetical protein
MDRKGHLERHNELHAHLDELLADFMQHTGKLPSRTPILELMQWSIAQCTDPTAPPESMPRLEQPDFSARREAGVSLERSILLQIRSRLHIYAEQTWPKDPDPWVTEAVELIDSLPEQKASRLGLREWVLAFNDNGMLMGGVPFEAHMKPHLTENSVHVREVVE